jgi:hypothetical protein
MSGRALEVFVDANFCGDWCPKEAAMDQDTAQDMDTFFNTQAARYYGNPNFKLKLPCLL